MGTPVSITHIDYRLWNAGIDFQLSVVWDPCINYRYRLSASIIGCRFSVVGYRFSFFSSWGDRRGSSRLSVSVLDSGWGWASVLSSVFVPLWRKMKYPPFGLWYKCQAVIMLPMRLVSIFLVGISITWYGLVGSVLGKFLVDVLSCSYGGVFCMLACFLPVCLPYVLSACLSACLPVCLPCLSCLFVCLLVFNFVCLSCLSVCRLTFWAVYFFNCFGCSLAYFCTLFAVDDCCSDPRLGRRRPLPRAGVGHRLGGAERLPATRPEQGERTPWKWGRDRGGERREGDGCWFVCVCCFFVSLVLFFRFVLLCFGLTVVLLYFWFGLVSFYLIFFVVADSS